MCELTRNTNSNRKKTVNNTALFRSFMVNNSRAIVTRRAVAYLVRYIVKFTSAYGHSDEEVVAKILEGILEKYTDA